MCQEQTKRSNGTSSHTVTARASSKECLRAARRATADGAVASEGVVVAVALTVIILFGGGAVGFVAAVAADGALVLFVFVAFVYFLLLVV